MDMFELLRKGNSPFCLFIMLFFILSPYMYQAVQTCPTPRVQLRLKEPSEAIAGRKKQFRSLTGVDLTHGQA